LTYLEVEFLASIVSRIDTMKMEFLEIMPTN